MNDPEPAGNDLEPAGENLTVNSLAIATNGATHTSRRVANKATNIYLKVTCKATIHSGTVVSGPEAATNGPEEATNE